MKEELIQIRRDIHAHPELSFQEKRTADIAEKRLLAHGFEVRGRFGEYGLYADFGDRPRIAIRCEMDALPIAETNLVPYASTVPDVCHACGHDATVACILGAAQLLQEADVAVRVILQSGEETVDENGVSGAKHAVEAGALGGIQVLTGLHVDPTTTSGSLALLPIALEQATSFSASVTAPNIWCKFDGQLSGTRKADFDDIKSWVEKKFGTKEFEIVWRDQSSPAKEINPDPLLQALSFVSRNAQLSKRKTWSNSFSEYAKLVPCLLILLGCEIPGDRRSQHTGKFDIDEACLPVGAAALAALVRAL